MRLNILILLIFGFIAAFQSGAAAADGMVLGLSPDVDELELFKSPDVDDPARVLGSGDLSFPTPILGVSNNDMYKIKHEGGEYWVISDDDRVAQPL